MVGAGDVECALGCKAMQCDDRSSTLKDVGLCEVYVLYDSYHGWKH